MVTDDLGDNTAPEEFSVFIKSQPFVHRSPWSPAPTTKRSRPRAVTSVINRYYDPSTDQFLSIDPIVNLTDQPYVFSGDNPLDVEDPLGLHAAVGIGGESNATVQSQAPITENLDDSETNTLAPGSVVTSTESSSGVTDITTAGGGTTYEVGGESLELTDHAATRLAQRGISDDQLDAAFDQVPFRYYYEGSWRIGYYDPSTGVFAGTIDGRITTVIDDVNQNYINNLKSATPDDGATSDAAGAADSGEGILGDIVGDSEDIAGSI